MIYCTKVHEIFTRCRAYIQGLSMGTYYCDLLDASTNNIVSYQLVAFSRQKIGCYGKFDNIPLPKFRF